MKTIKWLFIGLAGIILLAVIGITVLLLAVDKGEYKQEIIEQVETHTGRQLAIEGDLDISLFPWIGISIGELAMSNAAGFGDDAFVQVEAANIKVEVLPLLRSELRVDTIQLVGVMLDLQRNAEGTNNWDDLTGSSESDADSSTESAADTSTDTTNSPLAALAIGGINISDANIRWRDQQQGTDAKLRDFNLSIGEIKLHESFPLSLSFAFEEATNALNAEMKLSSEVTIDIQKQTYKLDKVEFNAALQGGDLPEDGVDIDLSTSILANLSAQTVTIDDLAGSLAKIPFSGAFEVTQLNTKPTVSGSLNIEQFSPREMMQQFSIEPPETANPDVLNSIKAQLEFTANESEAKLKIAELGLDSTTLSGDVGVALEPSVPDINLSLIIDQINLDDYLPPPAETPEAAGEGSNASGVDPNDVPIALPVDALAAQNLAGKLRIGKLIASKLTVTDVVVPISIRNGTATLTNMTAKLYSGTLDANATLDASGDQTTAPPLSAKANLFGVQVGPLLDDFQGDSPLTGTGDVRLDLITRGETPRKLKAALNGDVGINFRDGAVKGINVAQSLRNAKARLSGGEVDDNAPQSTDFSQLSVSGKIKTVSCIAMTWICALRC